MAISSKLTAADAKLVTVTVARGSIVTAEGTFTRGQDLQVTAAEARRFKDLGVVKPDDYVEPAEVQDGRLRIAADEGPNVSSGVA